MTAAAWCDERPPEGADGGELWGLFDCGGRGFELQRDDDGPLSGDEHAWRLVVTRALHGGRPELLALAWLREFYGDELRRIVREVVG